MSRDLVYIRTFNITAGTVLCKSTRFGIVTTTTLSIIIHGGVKGKVYAEVEDAHWELGVETEDTLIALSPVYFSCVVMLIYY